MTQQKFSPFSIGRLLHCDDQGRRGPQLLAQPRRLQARKFIIRAFSHIVPAQPKIIRPGAYELADGVMSFDPRDWAALVGWRGGPANRFQPL